MGDYTQPERLCLGRQRARNVAEADQSEHASGKPMNRDEWPHLPTPRLHQRIGLCDLAAKREDESHCMVGNLVHAIIRHVGHGDAKLARGGDIDVVDAEPEPADCLAFAQLPQQVAGQPGVGDENRVGVARHGEHVVGGRAFCCPKLRIDALERGLCGVERGKRAVGNRDQEPRHQSLSIRQPLTILATPPD